MIQQTYYTYISFVISLELIELVFDRYDSSSLRIC